jgi:hypothetical protein
MKNAPTTASRATTWAAWTRPMLSLTRNVLRKEKVKRSVLLLALLLAGCGDIDFAIGPGMADFSAPLCGKYHLIRSSSHQIQVSPMGYGSSTPIIPVKVVELGHDDLVHRGRTTGFSRASRTYDIF